MTEGERQLRERGRLRREKLLQATIDVISERGIGGVTHRAVAAAAGLPASSTSYFFESIDELMGEAVASAMARELARISELRESLEEATDRLPQLIDTFIEFLQTENDPHTVAQFEMYLFASRHPEIQRHVAGILDASWEVAAEALRAVGITRPLAAESLLAVIDGFALHRVAHPDEQGLAGLRLALHALFVGFSALESADRLAERSS